MKTIYCKDDNFKPVVLESKLPVIVDFFSNTCPPCRMLSPIIDELSEELDGKALVVKVDVDECPKTASDYEITTIPTIIIFKDGKAGDKSIGFKPKDQIIEMLNI